MSTSNLPSGLKGIAISDEIEHAPFPAATKQAAGLVNGIQTDVSSVYFADKILITISQSGRLSQWVWVCTSYILVLSLLGIIDSSSSQFCIPDLVRHSLTVRSL